MKDFRASAILLCLILLWMTGLLTSCRERARPLPPSPPVISSPTDQPEEAVVRDPTAPKPVLTLRLEPERLSYGESAILTWDAVNADRVWVDHDIGVVGVAGRIKLFPEETTTYVVRAEGAGGSTEASATVEVIHGGETPSSLDDDPNLSKKERFSASVKPVYFGFDSAELTEEARLTLDGNIRWLTRAENLEHRFVIEGHCDVRGSQEYNFALGDRRAQVVKRYLESRGVNGIRVITISLGEERPFVEASTESEHALNRRAHFVFLED